MENGRTIPLTSEEQLRIKRDVVLGKALTDLAEARGLKLSRDRLSIYLQDLEDLPIGPLLKAIDNWRRDGSAFFPQVPELRRLVKPPVNEDAEAEYAWERFERWVMNNYHPDRGIQGRHWNRTMKAFDPPEALDPRTERAMRALGGPHAVWSCCDQGEGTTEAYPFVRRDFIAAYKLAPAVDAVVALSLSDGGFQKLLGEGERKPKPGLAILQSR